MANLKQIFEYGMSRCMVHALGSMQVVSHLGGMEILSATYPHLQIPFFHISHLETVSSFVWKMFFIYSYACQMWIMFSHVPLMKPKQTSRKMLQTLCNSTIAGKKMFNPCPTPLMLAVWDMGACAQRILGSTSPMSSADRCLRDRIFNDVFDFQPEEYAETVMSEVHGGGLWVFQIYLA